MFIITPICDNTTSYRSHVTYYSSMIINLTNLQRDIIYFYICSIQTQLNDNFQIISYRACANTPVVCQIRKADYFNYTHFQFSIVERKSPMIDFLKIAKTEEQFI
jgi:hypothetical protein